jgi:hypothetical protein
MELEKPENLRPKICPFSLTATMACLSLFFNSSFSQTLLIHFPFSHSSQNFLVYLLAAVDVITTASVV